MGDITIGVETAALEAVLDAVGPRKGAQVIVRAVNRTGRDVRVSIIRRLSAEIGRPQKEFRPQVRLRRARAAAVSRVASGRQGVIGGRVKATATITSTGSDISLRHFGAKQTKKGITFKPGRKIKRRTIDGAFLARVPSGASEQVFIRATNARNVRVDNVAGRRRRKRVRRGRGEPDLPIAKITVPGVSSTMLEATIQRAVQEEASGILSRRLAGELRFELLKAQGKIKPRQRRTAR